MYTVFYKKSTYNPHRTYFRNANRFVGSRGFATVEEARQFAATVAEPCIYSPAGKKVSL